MATSNKLKAYVRYDGTGRVIPGSLILQTNKPKVGNWKRIPAYECNDPLTDGNFLLLENSTTTPCSPNYILQENGFKIVI